MLTSPIDASIGNRFRGVKVPPPSEAFERQILARSCPLLDKSVVDMIVKSVRAIKKAAGAAFMEVLQVSVRDMIDAGMEYPYALQMFGDSRLAVRYVIEGTIQKVAEETNVETLKSAVFPICGDLKTSETPFD